MKLHLANANNPKRTRMVVAMALAGLMMSGAATTAFADDAAALWDKHCASCHGKDGKGKTNMGTKLKVRDLTDPAVKAKVTKAKVVDSMKNGVKGEDGEKLVMKSYSEKLSDAEIQALADFTMALK